MSATPRGCRAGREAIAIESEACPLGAGAAAATSACPSPRSQACPQANPACRETPPPTPSLGHQRTGRHQAGGGSLPPPGCAAGRQGCRPPGPEPLGFTHGHSPPPVSPQVAPHSSHGKPAASLDHGASGPLPPQGPRAPLSAPPALEVATTRPHLAVLRLTFL